MFILTWLIILASVLGLVAQCVLVCWLNDTCRKVGYKSGEASVTHRGRDLAVKLGVGHHYLKYYTVDAPPEVLFDYKPWVNAKRCAAIDAEYAKDPNWMPTESPKVFNERTDACGPSTNGPSKEVVSTVDVTSGAYQSRGVDVLRCNKVDNYRVATCSGYSCEITGELVSAEKMAAWIANSLNRG